MPEDGSDRENGTPQGQWFLGGNRSFLIGFFPLVFFIGMCDILVWKYEKDGSSYAVCIIPKDH